MAAHASLRPQANILLDPNANNVLACQSCPPGKSDVVPRSSRYILQIIPVLNPHAFTDSDWTFPLASGKWSSVRSFAKRESVVA